jgi:hypothetical protein
MLAARSIRFRQLVIAGMGDASKTGAEINP